MKADYLYLSRTILNRTDTELNSKRSRHYQNLLWRLIKSQEKHEAFLDGYQAAKTICGYPFFFLANLFCLFCSYHVQ
jgi:hypothetical protein